MKIKIEIMGGDGKSLKDLVEPALKSKGYQTYQEFAEKAAKITGSTAHAEVACISRVMLGETRRLDPYRAKAYAKILDIPETMLLELGGAGNYYKKTKPIVVDDKTNITQVIKRLAERKEVSVEDLVKELLYMQHQ